MERPFRPPSKLRGPEHVWKQMRAQSSAGFTLGTLHGATAGVTKAAVKTYLYWCIGEGFVRKVGEKPSIAGQVAHVYSLAEGAPQSAPVMRRKAFTGKRGLVQEHLWTAMRSLPSFGVRELAFAASTEELPIKPRTAESYVRDLAGADVLLVLRPYRKGDKGRAGAHAGLWRLKPSRNTGPKPLKVIKGQVFDPNTGATTGERAS